MKTKRLLCLAAAAFFGMSAYAQEPGDYFFKNVESGRYLNGANSWGTKASVTDHGQLMTLAAVDGGGFTIDSHYSNGGNSHYLGDGTNTYVDAGPTTHTFEAQADGSYAIKDNNGKYLSSDGKLVNFKSDVVNGASKWILVSKADVLAAAKNATVESPVDFTGFIGDANFSRNNQDFVRWVAVEGELPGKANAGGDEARNLNVEKWGGNSTTFNFKQELSGLPNGVYRLKLQGFYRYNNTVSNTNDVASAAHADGSERLLVSVYGNSDEMPLMSIADEASVRLAGSMPFSQLAATEAFEKGAYQQSMLVVVDDGTLVIGVKKTEHEGTDWTVVDNFELEYFGNVSKAEVELASFVKEYKTAMEAATSDTNATMNADVLDALKNAISDNTVDLNNTTEEALVAAVKNLKAAIEAADASIETYNTAVTYIIKAANLDDAGTASYAANATVKALTEAYNTRSLVSISDNEKAALDEAIATAAKAQGVGADMTLAIVNPSFETGNTTGWTYEPSSDHGAKKNSNGTYTMSGCDGSYLFNIWSVGNEISQTVTGLKPGKYNVTAIMATDANQMFFIALNGTKGELVSSVDKGTGVKVTTDAYVGQDGELEIVAGTQGQFWYKVDDFRLTYVSEETVDPAVIEAQKLAAAKEAKTAAINALSPVGDGLFQYSSTNVAAALQAVEDAKTIVELDNVAIPVVTAPDAKRAFQLTSPAGNYVTIDNGVQLASVQEKLYFKQAENGDFYITDGSDYIANSGANDWDFSSYSNASDTYKVLPAEGGIVIKSDNGFFGFDSDVDGGLLYRDKAATVFGLADYVEPVPVIDDVTYIHGSVESASGKDVNITYSRNFATANKWQSLYVPFAIDMAKVQDDIVIAKVDDVVEENGELAINIVKASASEVIDAKTPLFIAAKTAGDKKITVGTSQIVAPQDDATSYTAATFYGVLAGKKAGIDGNYIMSNGSLCYVPASMADVKLGVNHWYMAVNAPVEVKIRINAEGFNSDEATAIANAVAESVENGEIFSINGAKVKDAKSGLYIKGGKKVLVK